MHLFDQDNKILSLEQTEQLLYVQVKKNTRLKKKEYFPRRKSGPNFERSAGTLLKWDGNL